MRLFAKAVYDGIDPVIYQEECNQNGFNALFERGQELKSNNKDVDYEIGVFTDDFKLFWSINPFPLKVAKNYLSENFEKYAQEELKSYLSADFQNDKLEMEFALKKQKEWEDAPDFAARTKERIEIWGRLGISLAVTPEELDVLIWNKEKAQELLIKLVQSDRCTMYGDTYFPDLVYNNYEDLDFVLPEKPIHNEKIPHLTHTLHTDEKSLESQIKTAKERTGEPMQSKEEKEIIK